MNCTSPRSLHIVVFFLILPACTPGTPEKTPMDLALEALTRNDFSRAASELEALLEKDPENEVIHLALGIASLGQFLNRLDWIITLALSFSQDLQALAYRRIAPQGSVTNENDYLLGLIEDALRLFVEPLKKAVLHFDRVRSPDTTLKLDRFYLYFLTDSFLDLSGEFRRSDAAFFEGLGALILFPLQLLYAHDLRFDVYLLVHKVLAEGALESSPKLTNLIVSLLNAPDYPHFLELKDVDQNQNGIPDGQEMIRELRDLLVRAFSRFAQLSTWATENPGIVRYKESSEGERFLLLEKRVRMDEEGVFSFEATRGSFQTLAIPLATTALDAYARLAANLEKGENAPRFLSLYGDLFPIILPWVLAVTSHLNSPTLKTLLNLLGNSPDGIISVLKGFLPDLLYFDFSSYFTSPQGIRQWIPYYRSDLSSNENNFLFEWECPGFFAPSPTAPLGSTASFPGGQLTCPDKEDPSFKGRYPEGQFHLVDTSHFSAPEFSGRIPSPINPDGILSPFPYIPFPDPTFSGVLYLEAQPLFRLPIDSEPQGVNPAGLRGLNAYIATVVKGVLPLFSRFF